ncbi:hypothetical protein LZP97_26860 (plasmid) [Rhodococcus sp. DMF-1]|uniref:hypothetical protein n=1 Tax=Rhodococcus TaxID=1827 RepID=UPI00065FD380|nr:MULTISPECIES: hypothetical protein [Rhodococcus]UIR36961.1 hypothetical protein LZP97_25845 [Rhodococcus sp. DMF-1]UIR39807.1 hypothetical protein LZP97_26860 [Rhodococcus sp. DMF-1]
MTCDWPVDRTCLPTIAALPDTPTPEQVAQFEADHLRMQAAVDSAVTVLWALTGRRFGACPVVARPCPRRPDPITGCWTPGIGFMPILDAGVWRNVALAAGTCDPYGPNVIDLPGPVQEITTVTVDGVVLAPDSYELHGDRLYRAGGQSWPGQDLSLPPGAAGTWSVEYLRGTLPPAGAAHAVGQLAVEFWNACSGGKCQLPRRVTSISRQGVTVQKVDPTDLISAGQTGIPEVDLWVYALNPNKLAAPPRVISPDARPR